jgi:hypothetical protein
MVMFHKDIVGFPQDTVITEMGTIVSDKLLTNETCSLFAYLLAVTTNCMTKNVYTATKVQCFL